MGFSWLPEARHLLNRDPMASDLKPYEQFRIRVTGQESVDPEWPSIPVIEIETLRLVD